MDMQDYVNGLSARWQKERAETQMTLGKMIEVLEAMPPDTMIDGLQEGDSYRGYYSDFAFALVAQKVRAADLLKECKEAMGQVFHGYKGGDYVMGALTPVWVSDYGTASGLRLMAINPDGSIVVEDEPQWP